MKLINSIGPNSHVVRMFAAEKGIELEMETIDIVAGESRKPAYLKKNPAGTAPCLELDDGTYISEIAAICEYLEDRFPLRPLIGSTPEQKAEARMWTRRMDLDICEPIANGYRWSQAAPAIAEGLKRVVQEKVSWLDGLMVDKQFLCGNRFTLVDIHLFAFLNFGSQVGQPVNEENRKVVAWLAQMQARSTSKARTNASVL